MKRIIVIIGMLLLGAVLYAHPVTPEKALQVASSVFASSPATKASSDVSSLRIVWDGEFEPATKAAQDPAFYVITHPEGGFVMVSGNDNAEPVLGFSLENDFRVEGMPGNVRAWMEQYKAYVRSTTTTTPEIQEQWKRFTETKAFADPITEGLSNEFLASRTVLWNQTNPANFLCPDVEGEEATSYCGCTALAIAEIMVWFGTANLPSASGVVPEYSYTADNGVDVTVPAHELGFEYDWAGMQAIATPDDFYGQVNGFSWEQSQEQIQALVFYGASRENPFTGKSNTLTEAGMSIAHLVYDISTLLKSMFNYGTGTSAYPSDLPELVSPSMGYNRNAQYVEREAYTRVEWERLIKDQVDQHPTLYCGYSSSGAGHAYVADGYGTFERELLFHFNMGWGGACNGYYRLNLQDEFECGHAATLDFYPDPESVALPVIGYDGGGLQYISGYNTRKLSYNVLKFYNLGTATFTGDIGVSIEDYSGSKKDYGAVITNSYAPNHGHHSRQLSILPDPSVSIVFGDYLTMYYKEAGKDEMLPFASTPLGDSLTALPYYPAAAIKKAGSYHVGDYFKFEIVNNSYVHHYSRWRITRIGGDAQEYTLDDYHAQLTEAGEYKIEATIYDADDPTVKVERLVTYIIVQ